MKKNCKDRYDWMGEDEKGNAIDLTAKKSPKTKPGSTKKTGIDKISGKSDKLGYGGRAAQLERKGVPGGVIGDIARAKGAAKGGKNYHGK